MRAVFHSPLGKLSIRASERGIAEVSFSQGMGAGPKAGKNPSAQLRTGARSHLKLCLSQMQEYFAGRRSSFALSFDLAGTEFQRRTWRALGRVPFGTVVSYAELARKAGSPRAARAVGTAMGKNPLAILLPCHRVIPSSRKVPGNYAGGVTRKKWLLKHERISL
jgi:methylated-DNA-[protein]-cysteine S-methyltransferase